MSATLSLRRFFLQRCAAFILCPFFPPSPFRERGLEPESFYTFNKASPLGEVARASVTERVRTVITIPTARRQTPTPNRTKSRYHRCKHHGNGFFSACPTRSGVGGGKRFFISPVGATTGTLSIFPFWEGCFRSRDFAHSPANTVCGDHTSCVILSVGHLCPKSKFC